ncbi:MAG: hypothetical protein Q7T55_25750, partial [Solirubrobacteraceae bacterium]|nr:hypothetical protein [Solirubrobacteraceae bacterium]
MSRDRPTPRAPRPTADLPGGRTAAVAFAVVIIVTALSFALAQRLKREPTLLYGTKGVQLFSPKLEDGENRARFAFRLRKSDTITATVTTRAGDPVRTLFTDRYVRRREGSRPADLVQGSWNGAYGSGKLAPDGEYRVRIAMRDAGRAVVLPLTFELDTEPPTPKLLSIGPEKTGGTPRPELLPRADDKPINVRFRVSGRSMGIAVIRTDLTRPRLVLDVPIASAPPADAAASTTPVPTPPPLPPGISAATMNGSQGSWSWNGVVDGRR